ncbi:MAG TPA: hypothetical protein VHF58_01940 [Solirubrobacterales bacterium]|nr:hypothetical protein [Solirubrobacterales bacterium]
MAAGVNGCSDADHEVVDVRVEETDTEVTVDAALDLDNEPLCEIRSVHEPFTVELDAPLGSRRVVDTARGPRSVIWSPSLRRAVLRRLAIGPSDAAGFVQERFPGGDDIVCVSDGPAWFSCELRARGRRQPVGVYVRVRAGPRLEAIPERPLSRELREVLQDGAS